MQPRTYEVTVLRYDQLRQVHSFVKLGEVTVTEEMYRREQDKLATTLAQIEYHPKHCAQEIAIERYGRKDIFVKMV